MRLSGFISSESAFFRKRVTAMDAEFLQLAERHCAWLGLQVANQPHWAEGAGVIVSDHGRLGPRLA